MPEAFRRFLIPWIASSVMALSACSINNAKKSYVLGEKLWSDGKYAAAVLEFEKAHVKDPRGKIGRQALLRAATTQAWFLSQYPDALRKLKLYLEESPAQAQPTAEELAEQTAQLWEVQKMIGEILFSKMEAWDQAAVFYRNLLNSKPSPEDAQEFLYRVGKSQFYLSQFNEAARTFRELAKTWPNTSWGEKATYQIGVTYFTRGEQHPGGQGPGMESYQEAMDAFEYFLKKYPKSPLVPEARFGIANCLEELDQLDAAHNAYEVLLGSYPSPKVIQIKLARIKERKAQRSR